MASRKSDLTRTMHEGVIDQRQRKITGEDVKENGLPMELRSICNE